MAPRGCSTSRWPSAQATRGPIHPRVEAGLAASWISSQSQGGTRWRSAQLSALHVADSLSRDDSRRTPTSAAAIHDRTGLLSCARIPTAPTPAARRRGPQREVRRRNRASDLCPVRSQRSTWSRATKGSGGTWSWRNCAPGGLITIWPITRRGLARNRRSSSGQRGSRTTSGARAGIRYERCSSTLLDAKAQDPLRVASGLSRRCGTKITLLFGRPPLRRLASFPLARRTGDEVPRSVPHRKAHGGRHLVRGRLQGRHGRCPTGPSSGERRALGHACQVLTGLHGMPDGGLTNVRPKPAKSGFHRSRVRAFFAPP